MSDEHENVHKHGLNLIPAWKSNYVYYKVWGEYTYLFRNFNGAGIEVCEWISILVQYFARQRIKDNPRN